MKKGGGHKLDGVKKALGVLKIEGMTVTKVGLQTSNIESFSLP